MATVHISEAEAARDFGGVLARVRAGDEVLIESGDGTVAVVHAPELPRRRISEMLAIARERGQENAGEGIMSADFARDLERRISERKPRRTGAWD